jgi:antitoxin component of MazEF toxin-antitoxin module
MTTREIVIQSCGCVAIPEDVAGTLGMTPGTALTVVVDEAARSLTLTSRDGAPVETIPAYTACPVKA